jgi:hypothetical protein
LPLDCETPKGIKAIAREDLACATIAQHYGLEHHKPAKECVIDRLFSDPTGNLRFVAEVKSRSWTREALEQRGSLLIGEQKIDGGRALSAILGVPFAVICITEDNHVGMWLVTNKDGELEHWVDSPKMVQTSKTVNDATKKDVRCYFLDMSEAFLWLQSKHKSLQEVQL